MINISKKIFFLDSVSVVTYTCYYFLYSPVYSDKLGLHLHNDNEKPIRESLLVNYKLVIYYLDGTVKVLNDEVSSVKLYNSNLSKKMNMIIPGKLFKYDKESAVIFKLDVTKAIDYTNHKCKVRKRSM